MLNGMKDGLHFRAAVANAVGVQLPHELLERAIGSRTAEDVCQREFDSFAQLPRTPRPRLEVHVVRLVGEEALKGGEQRFGRLSEHYPRRPRRVTVDVSVADIANLRVREVGGAVAPHVVSCRLHGKSCCEPSGIENNRR